jgi:hypothetical protein
VTERAQSENALSTEIVSFFRRKIATTPRFDGVIEVAERQQVLMNLTVGKDEATSGWHFYFGLQQQDITFFLAGEAGEIKLPTGMLKYHWLSSKKAQSIRVPLLICELKLRRTVTSHALITYSRIAEQIRDVHPHCAYFMVIGGEGSKNFMPATVLRQGKGFTRVFLDWETEMEMIWGDVSSHLDYLHDRAHLWQ